MNTNNFLQECVDNDWDLDADDIKHVLNLDFDYVRKQNEFDDDADCPKCKAEGTNAWKWEEITIMNDYQAIEGVMYCGAHGIIFTDD